MSAILKSSFSGINLEIQKNLQDKYFSASEKTKTLLESFRKCLQSRELTTTFHKSSKGSTGHTYLCSTPSSSIPQEQEIQPIGFVLKWQNPTLCAIEKIGAQIFRHFQLKAPLIQEISEKEAKVIVPFAEKIDCTLGSKVNDLPLIAMPRFHAANLSDSIKNGKLKGLSETDQSILLQKFGQITFLDLLIGNNDRFISFIPNSERKIQSPSSLNGGNVMIEFEGRKDSPRLVAVYPIDNCTANVLIERKIEEDKSLDGGFGLLECEESISDQLSLKEEEKLGIPINYPEIINEFHEVFKFLVNNQELLIENFKANLTKEIIECGEDPKDYESLFLLIPEHFAIGFNELLNKVKNDPNFINKVMYNKIGNLSLNNMENLISRNSKSLQEV